MKILLLQPPVQDFYDTEVRLQPIGLGYLKACVRKHFPQYQIILRDYHHGWGRRTIELPHELYYLREYFKYPDQSPFCTFNQYYHFGASFSEIVADIKNFQPQLVGISSLFTAYFREVATLSKMIKEALDVPIIVGGSHVSACPEPVLSENAIDFIIRGEGEKPFVEFLRFLSGDIAITQVPNLGYKSNQRMVFNPMAPNFELSQIPHADLSDFKLNHYKLDGLPLSGLITSRSCPHRCSFCSVHATFGHNYRRRSVDNVVGEIQERYQQGYRVIDFEDDNLTFYKSEMKQLCRNLCEIFPNREMRFVAMNGISYLSLDEELLNLMWEAGFTHLNLALVSSDQTVRETTKRPHTIEKYVSVVRLAHRLGFKTVSYQILGLPSEPIDSMIQTLSFNAGLPVLLGASIFYLIPGSPIAREFEPLSELDRFKARSTAMANETDKLSRDDLYSLFIITRIVDFLKALSINDDIKLSEIFDLDTSNERHRLGLKILSHLVREEELLVFTSNGFHINKRFRGSLFIKFLQATPSIVNLKGKIISNNFVRKSHSEKSHSEKSHSEKSHGGKPYEN